MKPHHKVILPIVLLIVAAACTPLLGDGDAESAARQWAESYFNFDYPQAMKLTAFEDQSWLRFAASNITEEDLEAINHADHATAQTVEVVAGSDTTATAYIAMSHLLEFDSIGGGLRYVAAARFKVAMLKRGGNWHVRLAGLPRGLIEN